MGASNISLQTKGVSQRHDREWALLLAGAASSDTDARQLAPEPGLDWDYIIDAADFHGLTPTISRFVNQRGVDVPEVARCRLAEKARLALDWNLALSGELVRVLRALNSAGINCVPFKGPALAAQLWGDFTLRQSMDIDLLVHPCQVPEAVLCLQESGYTPNPGDDWQKSLGNAVELPLQKRGAPALELQWGIVPRCFSVDLDFDGCWQRAQRAEFGGQRALAFVPEDMLLILCIHGWKHAWNRLVWVVDIDRLLRNFSVDWNTVFHRASESGLQSALLLGVKLAQNLCGTPLPAEIAGRASVTSIVAKLASESIAYMQSLEQPSYMVWQRYLLRGRERNSDRFRHVLRFLVTPNSADRKVLPLPSLTAPLYKAVRFLRVGHVAALYAYRRD